ncbi:transmembrane amino acid transporter protein [Fragilaria crotonensis]|nr:transmembrane amino acid transporter protein [Fragilaria crotonensis]
MVVAMILMSLRATRKSSSSISAATFNLIKACVGSGVLALPSGLALMTGLPKAAIPASILIIAIGGLSAYTFYILGSLCHERNANTLGDLWKDLVGPSWIVDLTTFLMTLGICLSYSIIIGDFSSALLSVDRRACILGITLTCLYPLARLPSLDALAPVSMVSIIGVLITCAVMVFQWTKRASLLFLTTASASTTTTTTTTTSAAAAAVSNNPLTALVLMSMAATSYVCHFSAPALLQSSGNNMDDYKRMTILGFSSVALINVIIMCAGFLTFGTQCAGIILNSYPSSNPWASLCRLLMLISIIGGYPILLGGAKSSLYNLIQSTRQRLQLSSTTSSNNFPSPTMNHMVTVGLLGSVTMASMVLENAGFVVGFNGATMGSAITYIFPAILAIKANSLKKKNSTAVTTTTATAKHKMIRLLNPLILGFGITSAIAGGAVSIASAFAPHLLQ